MDDQTHFRFSEEVVLRHRKYILDFKNPAKTSRDVLLHRDVWFVEAFYKKNPEVIGLGECAPLPGLSADNLKDLPFVISGLCSQGCTSFELSQWEKFPALRFGIESALTDLCEGGNHILFNTDFTSGKKGIPINGLVWMDTKENMLVQAEEKINEGYQCMKLKVGGINFSEELSILETLRKKYPDLELRVDANGALTQWKNRDKKIPDMNMVLDRLQELAAFDLHSIEQPVFFDYESYAELCEASPIPIALDEELIGVPRAEREILLKKIRPKFIVLKPTLLGGIAESMEWIKLADKLGIGWWVTSALESNIGLNVLGQWTSTLENSMCQGLGTGSLFTNNLSSPLYIQRGKLMFDPMHPMIFR